MRERVFEIETENQTEREGEIERQIIDREREESNMMRDVIRARHIYNITR